MEIRYTVPCSFRFELHCSEGTSPIPSPEGYALHFTFKKYVVSLTPGNSEIIALWHAEKLKQEIPIYSVSSLSFDVQDDSLHDLEAMCRKAKWEGLAQLLIDIANHALLTIRTYGGVTSVHPVYGLIQVDSPTWATPQHVLAEMGAQTSDDEGISWTPLSCGYTSKDTRMLEEIVGAVPRAGAVEAQQWMSMESKMGNDKTSDVSRLCLVNARESVKVGDGRAAVLEAVFALEIVVNRILKYYCQALPVPGEASNLKRIDFPQKLFLALPLAAGAYWDAFLVEGATKALAAISDRNDVAHDGDLKQGRLGTKAFWENLHGTLGFVETLLQHETDIQGAVKLRVEKRQAKSKRTGVPDGMRPQR